jgi:acetoin utilization deacetylase AcuC-like enzyme
LTAIREISDGHARNAFCVSRPPGGDISRDRQDGFGFFNHTAIAALHLRRRVGAERVLVVEWSDRPTVGTAGLLASAGGCRLVGIHRRILSADADLDDLHAAQVDRLDRATERWAPDWIVVGCGFDLLDELHFDVGAAHALTKDIRKRADDLCDGRIVSLLEGGYDAERLGAAAVQHLRALADLPQG